MLGVARTQARVVNQVIRTAAARGLDATPLLKVAGVSSKTDPDARISMERYALLYRDVVNQLADMDFGLAVGSSFRTKDLGLLGYTLANSRSLSDAWARVARYGRMLGDTTTARLVTGAESTSLEIDRDPWLDHFRPYYDDVVASVLSVSSELTDQALTPVEVGLPYARPTDTAALRSTFGEKLVFDCRRPYIALRHADLRRPVVGADVGLAKYLDRHAEQVLTDLRVDDSLSAQIQRILLHELSRGNVTQEALAQSLGMSGRTLQRRLKEAGSSFANEREQFRHRLALQLLKDGGHRVKEVAYFLGYSEPSTFNRAFKRWTGKAPREFRSASG